MVGVLFDTETRTGFPAWVSFIGAALTSCEGDRPCSRRPTHTSDAAAPPRQHQLPSCTGRFISSRGASGCGCNHDRPRYHCGDRCIDEARRDRSFAFFCDRGAESTSKELAGQYFRCDSLVEGVALLASAYWRATITAVRAACTTAVLTDPSSIPANPPRPWLPTTTSWADSEWSRRWRAGRSHTTTRRTVTSG